MNTNKIPSYLILIVCIAVPLLAGIIGSFATASSISSWYAGLIKPVVTPPGWVFGPVWTTLYILMGISLYLVVRAGTENPPVRQAIIIFAIQLIVNVIWSFAFFGLQSPLYGLITIFTLIALILATIYSFYRVSHIAAYLLIPYIAWVCIATYLNGMIFILN
jgi:translocator protein